MVNPTDPGPLDWRISIVDKEGRPSPEFQRRWNTNRNNTALIGGTITFGTGAPSGTPDNGAEYVDTSTTPYTFYIGYSSAWHVLSPIASGNPTATAGPTAINGSALTYMRSDAAPAIQKGSSSIFGIVKVDGTTITSSGGVISSTPPKDSRDAIVFDLGELTPVVAGTGLYHLRVPYRFYIVNVKAEVETPTTTGNVVVDINYGAASLLTTTITIPAGGRTSMEMAVQPVWSPTIMGDDGILEIDVDSAGDGTALGLKVQIIGYYTTDALTASAITRSLLGSVSQAALGQIIHVFGTIVSTLGEISQAATGLAIHAVSGTIVQTLGEITQAGAGTIHANTTGTIVQTLGEITQEATGTANAAPGYGNPDGNGDRQLTVTYMGSDSWAGGGPYAALDGSTANSGWLNSGQTGTLAWDFHRPRVITEITWKQSGATSQGTFNIDGSNDFSSWTTLTTGVNLGGTNPTVATFSNSTGYRFYRFNRTAGSTSNGPYVTEVEFKIDTNSIAGGYYTAKGSGNRSATITGSGTIGLGGTQTFQDMLNGNRSNQVFLGGAQTSGYIQWDFGTAIVINDCTILQSGAGANGTWQWSGSNTAGSGYVNIGSPQAWDPNFADAVFTELSSNTTAYRYYRLTMTAGTTSNANYIHEFNFSTH